LAAYSPDAALSQIQMKPPLLRESLLEAHLKAPSVHPTHLQMLQMAWADLQAARAA
jgi:hypothetical protein